MKWINENNLKEFVCGIITNLVRIQDSQSPTVAPSSLLSNKLKALGKLELVNTMLARLAIGHSLRNRAFTATTAHTNLIYGITLLGLVPQPVCFIRPGGAGGSVEHRKLAVPLAVHPEKEVHHISLLPLP